MRFSQTIGSEISIEYPRPARHLPQLTDSLHMSQVNSQGMGSVDYDLFSKFLREILGPSLYRI